MRTRVKICGVRTAEIARVVDANGVDFIGFVFAGSRRQVTAEQAAALGRLAPHCRKVGVFVDETLERVNEIAAIAGLDYVQLHGSETPAYARGVEKPVIKAFRWGDDFSAEAADAYPAAYILLDSFRPGMKGGTGAAFAWEEARQMVRGLRHPVFIAGGISSTNAAEALAVFSPYCLDVSGGVEEQGEKSAEKIKAFMQKVRGLEEGRA